MSHWYDSTLKKSRHKRDLNPGSSALEAGALTTRLMRGGGGGGGGRTWQLVMHSLLPILGPEQVNAGSHWDANSFRSSVVTAIITDSTTFYSFILL